MRTIAILLVILVSGCTTISRGPSTIVSIKTNPNGAQIAIDGIEQSESPADIPVDSKQAHMLVIKKECFSQKAIALRQDFGFMPWFFGNLLVAPVLGHIVDLITGSAWRIVPRRIEETLEPAPC